MKVVSYKCPNCLAPMKHAIESQQWECEFCGTHVSAEDMRRIQADVGTEQAETPFFPPEDASEAASAAGAAPNKDTAVAYVCPSCGGHIVTAPTTAATFCVYCHNPAVIASHLEGAHLPAQILPFQVKREAAAEALRKLCAKKPFLPRYFRAVAQKGEIAGLYVPFWLYDLDMQARLTGWGKRITSWSDAHYNYTKTDTYRVERAGDAAFGGLPADGSVRMDDTLMEALEPFDYGKMTAFEMPYLSGHFAESFDIDANQCFGRVDTRARAAMQALLRGSVSGYNSVSVDEFSAIYRQAAHRNVMLPVWTLSFRFRGKDHIYAMNGQSGKMVGKLPISVGRAAAFLGLGGAALSALCFLVLFLLRLGGAL